MESVEWVYASEELVEWVYASEESLGTFQGDSKWRKYQDQQSWEARELSWFAAAQQFSQDQTEVVRGDYQPDFFAVVFQASQPGAAGSSGFADMGETSFHAFAT